MERKWERKRYKKLLAWLLVISMTIGLIQGMSIAGLFRERVRVQAATMGVGSYLYLKTSFGGSNWADANADIILDYWDSGENHTGIRFEKVDSDYTRLKVTEGFKNSAGFAIKRFNPANNVTEIQATQRWTKGSDGLWNMANGGYSYNQIVSSGGNVMKITNWDDSLSFSSEWKSAIGGSDLYFYNMDTSFAVTDVKAAFFVSDTSTTSGLKALTNVEGRKWKVTIPEGYDYDSVRFTVNGNEEAELLSLTEGAFVPDSNNVYYYRSVVDTSAGTSVGAWGAQPVSGAIEGTLYFDNIYFGTEGTNSIAIPGQTVSLSVVDGNTYSCEVPSITKDTIICFAKDTKRYYFMWKDNTCNYVTVNFSQVAGVEGNYYAGGVNTVYYDASLSKLSYSDVSGDRSIPSKTGVIKYYATKADGTAPIKGNMIKMPTITVGAHKYNDVYRVMLPAAYTKIAFSNYEMASADDNTKASGQRTEMLIIDNSLTQPCFYADAGEQSVYVNGQKRGGYFAELGSVYNKAQTDLDYAAAYAGTEEDLLDVNTKYVKTTFFDYFSDLELDRIDRRTAGADNGAGGIPGYGYTNRTYAPNRIFNRVLSDYYKENAVADPLYFGHFQWYTNTEGTYFSTIASDMNLFGYDGGAANSNFLYHNNSNYRYGGVDGDANVAIQGLIGDTLDGDGELQLKEGVKAPYFDKDFVNGNNTGNVAVGKVYEDVTFPFTKDVNNYWVFNSKDTNLRLTKDSEDKYFMKNTGAGSEVKGYTNGAATAKGNFFPFNDHGESGVINKLDYGFGMKMDIDFSLTPNGKIGSQDIIFSFSGDDDIWIFIDGKLALDMGGSHGEVQGNLNFATKTAHVSKVKTTSGSSVLAGDTDKSFAAALDSDREIHTLTIFYMERGLWESNMSISFNFPETNLFTVDKKVDISGMNETIAANANVAGNVDALEFDFAVDNLVTSGTAVTVDQMNTYLATTGFDIDHNQLSDYGSYAASGAQLQPVTGATYHVGDTAKTVAGGAVTLKNQEEAVFVNMFRRGSYLMVTEQAGTMIKTLSGNPAFDISTLFDTAWKIKDKEGTEMLSGTGISPKDNRTAETYATVTNGIASGYLTGKNTLVYRNFENPESKVDPVDIGVSYTNTLKTGSLVIQKEAAPGSEISSTQDYTFTVTLNNIAGLHMEETWQAGYAHTDNQTISLGSFSIKKGEQKVITGIPIGTEYTVVEQEPADGSVLDSVTGGTAVVLGERKVTGVIKTTDAENTLTFYNAMPVVAAGYGVEYFVETDKAGYDNAPGGTVKDIVGTKYYIRKDVIVTEGENGLTYEYDYITSGADQGKAGVKQATTKIDGTGGTVDTFKAYANYAFNETTTQNAHGGTTKSVVAAPGEPPMIKLYYEKIPAAYRVNYYTEIDKAVYENATPAERASMKQVSNAGENTKYFKFETKLDGNGFTGDALRVPAGTQPKAEWKPFDQESYAAIDGTDKTFTNYAYNDTYTVYADTTAATLKADETVHVDLYYTKLPTTYKVKHYVEVEESEYNTLQSQSKDVKKQNDRFFKLKEEITDQPAYVGDTLSYAAGTEAQTTGKAGVSLKGFDAASAVENVATFKDYAGEYYRYTKTVTDTDTENSTTVLADPAKNEVRLYHEKRRNRYTERYYTQSEDQVTPVTPDGKTRIEIQGVIYDWRDDYPVDVPKESDTATVTDRREDYPGFQPIHDQTPVYPQTDTINEDGTTVIYQILGKVTYRVEYYLQVDKATYDAEEVNGKTVKTVSGKYFVLDEANTKKGAGQYGDSLQYSVKTVSGATAAGVKLKGEEVAATYQSYADRYYRFVDETTQVNGVTQDVLSDTREAVVQLFYEKIPADYVVNYYVEVEEAAYNLKKSQNEQVSKVDMGAGVYRYFVREAVTGPVTENAGDVIAYTTSGIGAGTKAGVTLKKAGMAEAQTVEASLKAFTNYVYSDEVTKEATDQKAALILKEEETVHADLYYVKQPAIYLVEYWLETDQTAYEAATEETGKTIVDEKYFVRYEEKYQGSAYVGDLIEYDSKVNTDTTLTEAGVTRESFDHEKTGLPKAIVAASYKAFPSYEYQQVTTKNADFFKAIVNASTTAPAVVKLFYEKTIVPPVIASYTEKYYIEVDKKTESPEPDTYIEDGGKIYKKNDSRVVTGIEAGTGVTVTDKQNETPYDKYKLVTVTGYPATDIVKADNSTVVYQIYGKNPANYTVEYYLEQDQAAYDAALAENRDMVGGKYFVKREYITKSANVDDIVTYQKSSDVEAGVTVRPSGSDNETKVTESFKSYESENYAFDLTSTKAADKYSTVVNKEGTAFVRLYYDKIKAPYTEKYYIQVEEKDTPGDYIEKDGVIYKVTETKTVEDQEIGQEVTVTDKQTLPPYTEYELTAVDGYPPTGVVKKDGSTIVYQIYKAVPEYIVEYYAEVEKAEYDAKEEKARNIVNGKYFVKAAEDVHNKAHLSDVVKYQKTDAKTAGVTINGTAVDGSTTGAGASNNTYQSFAGYVFEENDTLTAGKSELTVKAKDNIIQLYYVKPDVPPVTANYTVRYFKQVSEPVYNNTSEADRVKAGELFFVKAAEPVVNVAEAGDIVRYDMKDDRTAGVTRNMAKADGVTGNDTYKAFEKYQFSETTTVSQKAEQATVKEDGSTVIDLYYVKHPTDYQVEYWLQVDETTYTQAPGEKNTVDGKYFVKETAASEKGSAFVGDVITCQTRVNTEKVTEAGIHLTAFDTETAVPVENTFKAFDGYDFKLTTTVKAGKVTDTAKENETAVVWLYYEKQLTYYTEEYYLEVFEKVDGGEYITTPEGKIYRKNERRVVKDQEPGKVVTVTDKQDQDPYKEYKLIEITGYPKTDTVKKDGSTIVYQIYERKPVYTVEYYVEVDEETYNKTDEKERDKVGGKFFVKKEEVVKTAEVNEEIRYDYTDDDDKAKAGITISGTDGKKTVDDTYKSYENYEFKPGTTEKAKSYEDTVDLDKTAKVKLYYESIITKYTEKYYIQVDEEEAKTVVVDGENYIELTIGGKKTIFKKQDQEHLENQKAGRTVDVRTKENEDIYSDYELITTNVDGYPKTDIINEDGSTIVYQIYVRKAKPEEPETPVVEEPTTPPKEVVTPPEETVAPPEEVVAPPATQRDNPPAVTPPTTKTSTVKTGDEINKVVLWTFLISGMMVMFTVLVRKKEQQKR